MSVGAISWPLNPALVRRMFRSLWPGLVGAGTARCVKVVESGGCDSLVSGAAASLRSRRAGDGERPPPSPGVGQRARREPELEDGALCPWPWQRGSPPG
jgi:hypothetical protein